jgi:hypothetical protein
MDVEKWPCFWDDANEHSADRLRRYIMIVVSVVGADVERERERESNVER